MKWLLTLTFILSSNSVWAALGDDEAAVDQVRTTLAGKQKAMVSRGPMRIHEMTAHGNQIRQFVNPNGKVFAVSWRGGADPDLNVLLGSYYQELQTARQNRKRVAGRRPTIIKTQNLTFVKSGHMRDMRGTVYLNDQIPDGVSAQDLQ